MRARAEIADHIAAAVPKVLCVMNAADRFLVRRSAPGCVPGLGERPGRVAPEDRRIPASLELWSCDEHVGHALSFLVNRTPVRDRVRLVGPRLRERVFMQR